MYIEDFVLDGKAWPLVTKCPQCGAPLRVQTSTDLCFNRSVVGFDDIHGPVYGSIRYFVRCPICEQWHEIPSSLIPDTIRRKIIRNYSVDI